MMHATLITNVISLLMISEGLVFVHVHVIANIFL